MNHRSMIAGQNQVVQKSKLDELSEMSASGDTTQLAQSLYKSVQSRSPIKLSSAIRQADTTTDAIKRPAVHPEDGGGETSVMYNTRKRPKPKDPQASGLKDSQRLPATFADAAPSGTSSMNATRRFQTGVYGTGGGGGGGAQASQNAALGASHGGVDASVAGDESLMHTQGSMVLSQQQIDARDARSPLVVLQRLRQNPDSTEFVYLCPYTIDNIPMNPYHLEVVPHAQVNDRDFFTLSSFGVTHFKDGKPEFTELEQWKREHYLFNAIIKINLFKKYRLWKSYTVWRNNVRSSKTGLYKQELQRNLFWLNSNFCSSLLQIRKLCVTLGEKRLHSLVNDRLYTLEDFFSEQREQCDQFCERLEEFWGQAVGCLKVACASALQSLEERLFGPGQASTPRSGNNRKAGAPEAPALGGGRSSPRVSNFKYTVMASKRVEHRRLYTFIRLAEYIIYATLHSVVFDTALDLLVFMRPVEPTRLLEETDDAESGDGEAENDMQEEDEEGGEGKEAEAEEAVEEIVVPQREALYSVEILFVEEDLVFAPTSWDFQNEIDGLVRGFVETVSASNRLVNNEELEAFTDLCDVESENSEKDQDSSLKDILDTDPNFQDIISKIKNCLSTAYEDAEEYKKIFEPFKELCLENDKMDIEEIREGAEEGSVTLDNFREDMVRFHEQTDEISELPTTKDIGLVRVDTQKLKGMFLPSPQQCLDKIEDLLPVLAREKYDRLLNEVNTANQRLTAKHANVTEFVDYLTFLQDLIDRRAEIQLNFEELSDHYALMSEQNVAVPEVDRACYQMLIPEYRNLVTQIELADAARDENIVKWSSELEAQIVEFQERITTVKANAQDEALLRESEYLEPVIAQVVDFKQQITELDEEAKRYEQYQTMFSVPISRFPDLEEASQDINLKLDLWEALRDAGDITVKWAATPFKDLELKDMTDLCNNWYKTAVRACRNLPDNNVGPKLKGMVEGFKLTLPVVESLKNDQLQDRHWEKIEDAISNKIPRDDPERFTFGVLLDLKVMDFKDTIATISTEASAEHTLTEMLQKVDADWLNLEFQVMPYKDQKEVYILGGVEEVMQQLDESMVTMSTIMASRYVSGIRAEVEKMETQLRLVSETLDEWTVCQRNWMYLESIFFAPDIQKQLPTEFKQFQDVDRDWRKKMKQTWENPNALKATTTPGLKDNFISYNETLDKIQKSLEDYLETKRTSFARFYFLSNDELLEILAQTKNPQAVQPHMIKCFDNIKALDFKDVAEIGGIKSSEGELVELTPYVRCRQGVEMWLSAVERTMRESLRKLAKVALHDFDRRPRHEWVFDHSAALCIMIAQIGWCRGMTEALQSTEPLAMLKEWYTFCIEQLNNLCALVRGELSSLDRSKIGALITIDVHARDIVEILVNEEVIKENEFGWQMRLRYYWNPDLDGGDCEVRQSNTCTLYGYEYLGATPRLVITPLTDRCYMTITGALHLKLGGAPAGPAGTGKTETTKDLAKALGRQCVVFNCGDNLDFKFMGKFFSGIAQSGAWACFDEFNRINIEVLSVVAQQLLTIQNALKANATKFDFQGSEIKLVSTCGVFITMNPGYAGRTELPDNLKALFRPVSMMIPDYALVAEVMLFSEGFEEAKSLSRKMVKLYKLSSEQLSQQDHYDFGMRAVKSVLVMAGALKRANPTLNEGIVLIRAMRDANVPKFLADDVILFQAIIRDLFPEVEIPENDFGELQDAVVTCMERMDLQVVDGYVLKVLQLYETFNVRFGVMLVGPTGGGKTTCSRILQAAMTYLRVEQASKTQNFQTVHTYTLNPKSIKMGELYGEFNDLTGEWSDGLAASLIRAAVGDTSDDRHWVVLDGPVDAIWIENMNTVLDDNQTLCLPNGERIKLNGKTMRMLFEVEDLAYASPATVSRCGMVYIPPEVLGWRPYVQTWIKTQLPDNMSTAHKEQLFGLFELTFDESLSFYRSNCKEGIPTVDINLVVSCCCLFKSMFTAEKGVKLGDDAANEHTTDLVNKLFVLSWLWSIGGNTDEDGRLMLDDFMRNKMEDTMRLPGGGMLFDYYVDYKTGNLEFWATIVPQFTYSKTIPYFQMLVPTLDTVRFAFLMSTCMDIERSALFNGVTGVGKSVIVTDEINRTVDEKGLLPVFLNFSAQTSSIRTQETIESKLEKKRKGVYGAPPGKKIVLFVDDVNMPAREVYSAQPPIELLRQFQDFGGFYDRKKLFFMKIEDMTIMSACAPPGGGRNVVTPRFYRHFNMLQVPPPSESCMKTIFCALLKGFLENFPPDIKTLLMPIVDSSVEVYNRICSELLPTPAKSHYTFNLRDLSKVFQGILQVREVSIPNPTVLAKLWVHENLRVFHDRLINNEDKRYFKELLHDLIRRKFGLDWSYEDLFDASPLIFGDFLKMGLPPEDRSYELVENPDNLPRLLENYLDDYNMASTSRTMNLVFFQDAIDHVARISRIIRQPRGNAMLVGVGGSGKQSLTRLAAAMAEYACVQIELSRNYGLNEFREDVKKLYITAGVEGTPVVFLLSDTQIVNESFLEDINNVLNSGDVPNLFAPDEKEKVIGDVRAYVTSLGLPETRDVIFSTFINRVRDNLHIVLCMSPVGDAFRIRCRMFPSLINCCTIDWFDEWPETALRSVASSLLGPVDLGDATVKESLIDLCGSIHKDVAQACEKFWNELRRMYYTTPKSYLDLILLYQSMLAEKREEVQAARDRLLNGLGKLQETNVIVAEMEVELSELQPILQEKSASTEVLLKQVAADQEAASKVKATVGAEEAEVSQQTAETEAFKLDAQRDLDEALPALDAAVNALNSLSKGDLTEIKSFSKPPPLVMTVMESVCILLGTKPDWENAKKLLGDPNLIKRLIDYDKDNIPEKALKQLKKYIDNPDFDPEIVERTSKAAKSLCMWSRAMDVYSKVAKEVAPKREKLAIAEAQLAAMQATLNEKQAALKQVEDQVASLKAQLQEKEREKVELQQSADTTAKRLASAGKLTGALGDEQVRWAEMSEILAGNLTKLVGDVFLAAACISYYGAFTGRYRDQLISQWSEKLKGASVPCSDEFKLRDVMANAVIIREWNLAGLPSDPLSVDNGVLVVRGKRWPLMIDPQGQANKWIKRMEEKQLKIIKPTDSKPLQILESCIRIGSAVLLEDIGEILDPAMEPVLLKQTFKNGNRLMIRLGDSDVDYDPRFKLYMTTKLPNPHYLPEVCIKVTVINFTVTMVGLEDQLLGDVVRKECPQLEDQKDKLVVNMANDKKQLRELEDKVLRMLSTSEGNLLDNENLINSLNNSKLTSGMISRRVTEAEETEKNINIAREQYRCVATRGSLLYFVVADLARLDPMYQYSLVYFTRLFNTCMDLAEKNDDVEARLVILIDFCTEYIFKNVCRGLFEAHKLIFSLLICTSIMRHDGAVSPSEWNFLLRGPPITKTEPPPNPDPSWIGATKWPALIALEDVHPEFKGIVEHLRGNLQEWKLWAQCADPDTTPLPGDWANKLETFKVLLVLKVFREEKLVFAMSRLVMERLGRQFTESPPFSLSDIFADSDNATPIVFVLSVGADPTTSLLRFAEEKEFNNKLHMISLGQGQGPVAEKLMAQAAKNGEWCCLQNCHLCVSWMSKMTQIIDGYRENPTENHEDFRLWLTSMPSTAFPVPVLQNGIKITNEPPKGLRANLMRSFAAMPESLYEGCSKPGPWKKLLYGLSFFHAIVQERRKFGPLGWNTRYEFNASDLECSLLTLKMFLEEQEEIPWGALVYVTGQINYGGRVTDDLDRICLMAILDKYYTPSILDDGYTFSASGKYKAPPQGTLAGVQSWAKKLPFDELPEVFGMHDNANISFQMQETSKIIEQVLMIQPRLTTASGGKTSDEIVDELAALILSELPGTLNKEDAHKSTFRLGPTGEMNSVATVLSQEMTRFNKLLKVMRSSLIELQKAIKGLVVMSSDLDACFTAFVNNQVPEMWARAAYPSLKPLASWFKDLLRRCAFMRSWLENGEPKCFWLPGFFFPQGFMTGCLQNHARRYRIPIDALNFGFKVLDDFDDFDDVVEPPEDGCYINGLFLEAARWDKRSSCLADSFPGQMFATLPVIHFIPVLHYVPSPQDYQCPLYKTSVRAGVLSTTGQSTNFVLCVDLKTDRLPSTWTLQGTCMLCMLNT